VKRAESTYQGGYAGRTTARFRGKGDLVLEGKVGGGKENKTSGHLKAGEGNHASGREGSLVAAKTAKGPTQTDG